METRETLNPSRPDFSTQDLTWPLSLLCQSQEVAAFICTHVLVGSYPASAEDGEEEHNRIWETPGDRLEGVGVANGALVHR